MKILNDSNKLFYLKSANVIGGQNILLFFRQADKYSLRNTAENQYDYINVSLILWMENPNDANNECLKIKQYFLDNTVSIDTINDTEIEFIGNYDYQIKVKKYDENRIDQFTEDWIDRYLYATKFAFEQMAMAVNYYNLIKEIVNIARFSKEEIANKIMDKVDCFEQENNIKID
ncbi:hypothetical protein [Chryseobacterium vrystaatense]|uniref:Uncharacterized protein n=1 Tax=Chryseobacterium vrystaatense TaxID=307480 RepID=A0A1M4UQR8_9FLAO|nr:hypothetical protein [Chryseobacterium vrystaatense]SHE58998.1 hypothetical protein SAMN02787073_0701 [Chryseobacterium vrystaatense]